MKGRIEIRVSNNRARFSFALERNIPIVRGDSGTGTANTDSNRYGIELTDTSAALPYTVAPGIVPGLVD